MKKQSMTHEDFLELRRRSVIDISKSYIDDKVDLSVEKILKETKNKKVAYSWSGGKDSIALQYVCEKANINECFIVICNYEYPMFLKWVTENMPPLLEVVYIDLGNDYLDKNKEMLFPKNSTIAGKWFKNVQHRGQHIYYKKYNLDMIVLGRRKEDGNYVGKNDIYTNSKGITRLSPISNWTHKEVFALMEYYGLPYAPFYSWDRGFRCGTHPWPARQWCDSKEHGFREIKKIDPKLYETISKGKY